MLYTKKLFKVQQQYLQVHRNMYRLEDDIKELTMAIIPEDYIGRPELLVRETNRSLTEGINELTVMLHKHKNKAWKLEKTLTKMLYHEISSLDTFFIDDDNEDLYYAIERSLAKTVLRVRTLLANPDYIWVQRFLTGIYLKWLLHRHLTLKMGLDVLEESIFENDEYSNAVVNRVINMEDIRIKK